MNVQLVSFTTNQAYLNTKKESFNLVSLTDIELKCSFLTAGSTNRQLVSKTLQNVDKNGFSLKLWHERRQSCKSNATIRLIIALPAGSLASSKPKGFQRSTVEWAVPPPVTRPTSAAPTDFTVAFQQRAITFLCVFLSVRTQRPNSRWLLQLSNISKQRNE